MVSKHYDNIKNTEIEFNGDWIIHEIDNEPKDGQIKYNYNTGVYLELDWTMVYNLLSGILNRDSDLFYITGEIDDGRKISLIQAKSKGFTLASSNSSSRFISEHVIIGKYLCNSGTLYEEAIFSVPWLEEWNKNNGLQLDIKGLDYSNVSLSYNKPDAISFNSSGFNILIENKLSVDFSDQGTKMAELAEVRLLAELPSTLNQITEMMQSFARFVSLLTFKSSFPYQICLRAAGQVDWVEYFPGMGIGNIPHYESTHLSNYAILRSSINEKLSDTFKKWLSLEQRTINFTPILIEQSLPIKYYSQNNFLNVMQCFEGFHDEVFKLRKMEKSSYKIFCDNIREKLDSEQVSFLEPAFSHGNKLSLGDKIDHAFSLFDEKTLTRFAGDLKRFKKEVVSTRNYFTHFGQRSANVLTGRQLYEANQKIKSILICLYFREMGIPFSAYNLVLKPGAYNWR